MSFSSSSNYFPTLLSTSSTLWKRAHIKKPISLLLKEAQHNEVASDIHSLSNNNNINNNNNNNLSRSLSSFELVCFGIGCIIGTGVFVLTGTIAAQTTGPGLVVSMIIAAICSGLCGLCYAELASIIPIAGSAYTYSYAALGELYGWIIGWDLILEYGLAVATVAVGWSGYFLPLLYSMNIHFPLSLAGAPGSNVVVSSTISGTGSFNLLAFLIVLLITILLCFGISESSKVNVVIVVIKVFILILFIIVGFGYIDSKNYTPFIPPNTGKFGEYGATGILKGAGQIFFAYIGFDSVSTAAQEAKNPQTDMPIGILGSLGICTILYILTSLVLTGMTSYTLLNVSHPLAYAMELHNVTWLTPMISVGALCGLTSVMLVSLLGQTRIFYSMSIDGLLPSIFSKLHPTYRTPLHSTLLTGTITAFVAGIVPLEVLSEMTSMGTLLAFMMVCIGVVILRRTEPDLPRAFSVPYMPYVPIAGALICFLQMVFLDWATWLRLIVWLLIGLTYYVFYASNYAIGSRTISSSTSIEMNTTNSLGFTQLEDSREETSIVIKEVSLTIAEAQSLAHDASHELDSEKLIKDDE